MTDEVVTEFRGLENGALENNRQTHYIANGNRTEESGFHEIVAIGIDYEPEES